MSPPPPTLRLPHTVEPLSYRVDLDLSPERESFSGTVEAEVRAKEHTPVLWMHAVGLKILDAHLVAGGKQQQLKVLSHEPFLGLAAPQELGPGKLRVRVRYEGKLSDTGNTGFFCRTIAGRRYVFSQMEPLGARHAVPCWDEPGFKVPWTLTVRAPSGQQVFGNTLPAAESQEPGGIRRIRFSATRPMPSYLVALAVGPFDIVDAGHAGRRNTPVRIITPKGRGAEAAFAREAVGPLLEALERYVDRPYPYEKLDHIAVPDLGWGGMENPGLITYDESTLLVRPERQTLRFQRGAAEIIAHELAHQWFGNLVTMAWWDDLWLNEAFATWIAPRIVEQWRPAWNVSLDTVRSAHFAKVSDQLATARAVRQPISTEHDIYSAFDGITYEKGAAVLGMLESSVGERKFRSAVRNHLRRNAWQNATTEEFISTLEKVASRHVRPVFSSFLEQSGVPLVTASLGPDGTLRLHQQRCLPAGSTSSANRLWSIPLTIRFGTAEGVREVRTLMQTVEASVPSPGSAPPLWVQVNAGQVGYYRVRYQGVLQERLLMQGGPHLTLPERMGFLLDTSALVESGSLPAAEALPLLPRLLQGKQRHLLSAGLGLAGRAVSLTPAAVRSKSAVYLRTTFGSLAHEVGWLPKPGEDDDTQLLRPQLLSIVAGSGEDPALRIEARRLAELWLASPAQVPADIAWEVVYTAAIGGDRQLFERYRTAAQASSDPERRRILFGALGRFRARDQAQEALQLLLQPEYPLSELLSILFNVTAARETRDLGLAFYLQHFDALVSRLPGSEAAGLISIASLDWDDPQRAQIDEFLQSKAASVPGGPRQLAQALERRALAAAARRVHGPGLAAFFEQH